MSSLYMQHDDDSTPCLCSNCGTTTRFVELNAIDDIEQRIAPGEEVPAGECPECGCLAYLKSEQTIPQHVARQLLEAVRAFAGVEDFKGWHDKYRKPVEVARKALEAAKAVQP